MKARLKDRETIKAEIINKNNALVIGFLGEQFSMGIMVPQRAKESTKTPEGLSVSFPVSVQGKQDNMKDRRINSMVEMKKTVIHQRQIPGQHWGVVRSPSKIAEEGKTVDTDREEKDKRRKDKVVFPKGGGKDTTP